MNVDKVVMKEKIEATIDLLTQLLTDFTEEAPVVEEKPVKAAKGKKAPVQEEEVEEKPAKATTKGKKKATPEPEPEPEEEEDEDELTLEDLKGMDLAELKELATAQELEMPKKVTKATLLKAFEEQFFSEEEEEAPAVEEEPEEKPATKKGGKKKVEPEPEQEEEEEEEEEEELTAEDINEMSLEELKGIVKEYELAIPAATLKNVKKLRAAIIEIIEAPEEEEEDDATADSFEASSERLEAEGEIEKEIRQLLKNKKLTTAKMKKFLANYYEGNADCEDCSNCSTEELTACYIQTKQALVDDEGEVHEEAEAYTRNGEDYCCGVPLQEDSSCAICGSEYAEDEE